MPLLPVSEVPTLPGSPGVSRGLPGSPVLRAPSQVPALPAAGTLGGWCRQQVPRFLPTACKMQRACHLDPHGRYFGVTSPWPVTAQGTTAPPAPPAAETGSRLRGEAPGPSCTEPWGGAWGGAWGHGRTGLAPRGRRAWAPGAGQGHPLDRTRPRGPPLEPPSTAIPARGPPV